MSSRNTGSRRAPRAASIASAARCASRRITLCANEFSARLRSRPHRPVAGRQTHPAGGGVAARQHQWGRRVVQHRRAVRRVAEQQRDDPEEAVVDDDRVEVRAGHGRGELGGLVRHRVQEQADDAAVERLDGRGLPAVRRVERRIVEVGDRGQRVCLGAEGVDGVAVYRTRHHGDAVATGDQVLRDGEQRTDVSGGG